jgi:small subunit ribosomal protein S11
MVTKVDKKKKIKRNIPSGVLHIHSTGNNTVISLSDVSGEVVLWSSAGLAGFKGSKRGTPFAAQSAGEHLAKRAKEMGIKSVDVKVKGPGAGRESSIRSFVASGIKISSIQDVTPIPHNGCRPPKKRRV